MAKTRSKTADEADVIPPNRDETAPSRSGLRMPPVIDVPPGLFGRLTAMVQKWLKGAAYQTVLLSLLAMAIGLMVLTLFEAGNLSRPDLNSFWPKDIKLTADPPINPTSTKTPSISDGFDDDIMRQDETGLDTGLPHDGAPENTQIGKPAIAPTPDLALSEGAAIPKAGQTTDDDAVLADLRQTLADTRRDLAEAKNALLTVKAAPKSMETLTRLNQKAMLADLLLRLEYGLAFDDVLDSGQLTNVLSARELSVLALFADRGVPTEAGLRAQAESLPSLVAQNLNEADAFIEMPAALRWLAKAAPDFIRVTRDPMAAAPEELAGLHAAVTARNYEAAGQAARLILLAGEIAPMANSDLLSAVQALYADIRAFEETRAVLAMLRSDYLAGVRP